MWVSENFSIRSPNAVRMAWRKRSMSSIVFSLTPDNRGMLWRCPATALPNVSRACSSRNVRPEESQLDSSVRPEGFRPRATARVHQHSIARFAIHSPYSSTALPIEVRRGEGTNPFVRWRFYKPNMPGRSERSGREERV
jgi:hypothetical protein